ncbi:prolyl 4-hydroxylase subunit alpha-1-like isoform X2 [Acanthaster planci]|uniref:procollagen-proline 4-dioxygenase n=1 Tax=Acanthaster planci TaxID=133434 RepID=A0A8B7ZGH0_ACAPL|nr:prolyl 4-hydroxylase subunit alpha-1-like isoform X2 [Acanthaster planci]
MRPLLVLLSLLGLMVHCQGEVFTSLVDLEHVIYTESNMLDALREYVNQEELKIQKVKQLMDGLQRASTESVQDPELYLSHPVNALLLVKRFLWEWSDLENIIRLDVPKTNYLVNISQYRDYFPANEDLKGAGAALLRLQDTYKLDTKAIADGNIEGTWKSPSLTAHECFEVGRIAYNANDFYHSRLWMLEALDRLGRKDSPDTTVDKADILDYLSFIFYMNGDVGQALAYTDQLLAIDPEHERGNSNKRYFEYHISKREPRGEFEEDEDDDEGWVEVDETEKKPEDLGPNTSPERQAYEALCRGDPGSVKIPKNRRVLKCRYQHYNNPRLYLQPAKEEVVFDHPRLIIYHDILDDREIAKVKELAAPRLNRATIQNPVTGKLEYADYRISKSAWLREDLDPMVTSIRRRVSDYSGLELATAEELQVVNYGIGGHYEPHFDFARKEETNAFKDLGTGNRIATMLFYMSDVPAGGATVFPMVGARLLPKKGTGAFWYNLFPSGEGDFDTRHAACPVLVGSKWVSNIWIHEHGQEFRRKCGITPDVKY